MTRLLMLISTLAVLAPHQAFAATLTLDMGGLVTGATGLLIDGELFDITLTDSRDLSSLPVLPTSMPSATMVRNAIQTQVFDAFSLTGSDLQACPGADCLVVSETVGGGLANTHEFAKCAVVGGTPTTGSGLSLDQNPLGGGTPLVILENRVISMEDSCDSADVFANLFRQPTPPDGGPTSAIPEPSAALLFFVGVGTAAMRMRGQATA